MIPAAPHPLLMSGGGDPLDELGSIARSLRFRSAANAYISRNQVAGNRRINTIGFKCKKAKNAINQRVYVSFGTYAGSNLYAFFGFDATDALFFQMGTFGGTSYSGVTAAVFRDPAAHYDIRIAIDTTQATAVNRVTATIDGVAHAFSGGLGMPPQNYNTAIGLAGAPMRFGGDPNIPEYADCLISFGYLVDGANPAATSFGGFHAVTSQWRPKGKTPVKAVVDAGGDNSCFLPFDNTASLTTLCVDASSKGQNFTATNISLTAGATYDSMIDTPTNNFCTLNPINAVTSSATLANGALDATTGSTGILTKPGTIPMAAGKWYWEVTPTGGSEWYIGVVPTGYSVDGQVGASGGGYSYAHNANKWAASVNSAYGATYTTNDVIGVALDCDAGTITFYKNGVSQGQAFSGLAGSFLAIASDSSSVGSSSYSFNFGQRGFAYTPPTGFKALCTKNLSYPLISKSSSAFAAVTDSGANIAATLAAARAGWPDYIEIFKRRDAAEGWRWRFSDDTTNYLDSSSTAAKAAFPSLTGTSYVGYALKVAAANGIATGRLTHVNGAADVVADGLANARKMIILKNEATGGWYVYHPELTAGKLIYLHSTDAEVTDATISAVTSSGFTVAAALASGTYRWIALADLNGLINLRAYTANAITDGPFDSGDSPALVMARNVSISAAWRVFDKARSTGNVADKSLSLNASTAEATEAHFDLVSNGAKVRIGGSSGTNDIAGNKVITLKIAAFPIRYANAR